MDNNDDRNKPRKRRRLSSSSSSSSSSSVINQQIQSKAPHSKKSRSWDWINDPQPGPSNVTAALPVSSSSSSSSPDHKQNVNGHPPSTVTTTTTTTGPTTRPSTRAATRAALARTTATELALRSRQQAVESRGRGRVRRTRHPILAGDTTCQLCDRSFSTRSNKRRHDRFQVSSCSSSGSDIKKWNVNDLYIIKVYVLVHNRIVKLWRSSFLVLSLLATAAAAAAAIKQHHYTKRTKQDKRKWGVVLLLPLLFPPSVSTLKPSSLKIEKRGGTC